MSVNPNDLTPRQAWMPLSQSAWTEENARHLLRRIGFSAMPNEVENAMKRGLPMTVEHYFGKTHPFEIPYRLQRLVAEAPKIQQKIRKSKDEEEKRELRREQRMMSDSAYQDFAIKWLQFAREPENSPQEKYIMFLQDVFVVARSKVRATGYLFQHQNLMRREGFGRYSELVKSVSRSPAMIQYLDLNRSSKKAPNENFARELFELFTLGEGNYTEKDIKEAARAFTGYRFRGGDYRFDKNAYDSGTKTVFGQTGLWNGDEIIDIVYQQPAAGTFVPKEFLRFYLSEQPLPEPYIERLADLWRNKGYDMRFLIETVFNSRIFYQPQYRGNLIKSPIHYYVGLCQDLNLDIAPFPSKVLSGLRGMGQIFQDPPNVRGWVGGKHWINTTTIAARRQVAQALFTKINEENLNADEYVDLQAARANGRDAFVVTEDRLSGLTEESPEFIAEHFSRYFLPNPTGKRFQRTLTDYLKKSKKNYLSGIKDVAIAVLQSPQYQLS
ncbi:DUF1800 domain-containing protein [Rubellicoccus peritrichatus]|uniref:DUF1800 domain-containing protein n=1 Tax=Rubellicoccus peritrichatus TaxID=3080537 RepID=A0AAQ3L7E5_9BACT|nr:DUF1800 domain-containing protein [Puniceicoccus sp. CR14]WOO40017.1 DUF1800 domain-containing protein [Puniceicoccus sp. CR14]